MLDNETKRRIDSARDILVGKVPDPKSQVEQITIALIYKFMDDMDATAEELGGRRAFFTGDYEKYSWAKVMTPGRSGHEVASLYAEAITRMTENPGLPALFREIFKNAYLPYRDPETLKAFLKVIGDFSYDHSERLGDAFEYLLAVLGSQGDAGQFRTPRHIIDFMVALIDPQKNQRILDPACGTAGFLISAYKHILAANAADKEGGSRSAPTPLTPEERARLLNNIRGYDISPDMVRLSLVNLYLHGFNDPHIHEYDTLTSDERWHEYFDVIMANPPFMSPKGGIRPHKRFSVQSNRSEVLFVDYIAEHLTPAGRAAVIVPEGVIFQSGKAYKQLRKMLVEQDYLVGVISLPAGVFNPYSGVKTSILWLDKNLARRSDQIVFVKITNDGFDLGAQRREIKQNDLPAALQALTEYKASLVDGTPFDAEGYEAVTVVKRAAIAENGDYNLSGERYKTIDLGLNSHFPMVEIGEVCTFEYGAPLKKDIRVPGEYPVFGSNGIVDFHNEYLVEAPFLVVGRKGSAGEVHYSDKNGYPIDTTFYIKLEDENRVKLKYLYHILRSLDLKGVNVQAGVPGLNRNDAYKLKIPLPPLTVQGEIVAELEGYQKIIDGARMVVENYRPRIPIDPDWPLVQIGELCQRVQYGLSEALNTEGRGYKTFRMNELVNGVAQDNGSMKYADISESEFEKYKLFKGDILFNRTNSIEHVGRTGIFDLEGSYCFASYLIRLTLNGDASPFYVNLFMNTEDFQNGIKQFASRAIGQANINAKSLQFYRIPLPDLATQECIVAEIEQEQALVDANRQLIGRFEEKIRERISRVWGDA